MDTCLLMQDQMKAVLDYFQIDYGKEPEEEDQPTGL